VLWSNWSQGSATVTTTTTTTKPCCGNQEEKAPHTTLPTTYTNHLSAQDEETLFESRC
jgi:hypothetical protein